jgi:hypothetical protein
MAPGPLWTGAENLAHTGIRSPDRPARSQLLYQLSYPARAHTHTHTYIYNIYICTGVPLCPLIQYARLRLSAVYRGPKNI